MPKKSLILAGGGIKVAFQAGVLEVWLDEAGLTFDHADGASGGVFNLAMYCQGMSGKQIAENWRNVDPSALASFNWTEYAKLFYAESIATLEGLREKIFPGWGLDWTKIRATDKEATFNIYNFSRHQLEVITADRMTEDYLAAGVSLPMWFPPVEINGEKYIDAVYMTDANIQEAIRRGADELWIIWTVSDRDEWNDGFVATYFQIIETAANGHFRADMRRIEANNEAIARGEEGEYGRPIEVKLLKADVPLHYLINLSSDRLEETVNLGVQKALEWCEKEGIPLRRGADYETDVHRALTKLSFTEEMKGFVTEGETDPQKGFETGKENETRLMFRLTMDINGVNRFVTRPQHEAEAAGYIDAGIFGGKRKVEKGVFNLLTEGEWGGSKRMFYRLFFRDGEGRKLTLSGVKIVKDDPGFDAWSDTTTLFTKIYKGHVNAEQEAGAEVVAAGVVRIELLDFMKQLTTFRVEGPSLADKGAALARFGRLFFGKLWDVYAREVLRYGPL